MGINATGAIFQDLECKDASNNGGGGGTALCIQAAASNMLITNVHMHDTHQTFGDHRGVMRSMPPEAASLSKRAFSTTPAGTVCNIMIPLALLAGGAEISFGTIPSTIPGDGLGRSTGGLVLNSSQVGAIVHSNVIYGVVKGGGVDMFWRYGLQSL